MLAHRCPFHCRWSHPGVALRPAAPGQAARPEPAHPLRRQPALRRDRGRRTGGPRGPRLRGDERGAPAPRQGDQPAAWLRLRRVRAGGSQPGQLGLRDWAVRVAIWARGVAPWGAWGCSLPPLRLQPVHLSPGHGWVAGGGCARRGGQGRRRGPQGAHPQGQPLRESQPAARRASAAASAAAAAAAAGRYARQWRASAAGRLLAARGARGAALAG